VEPSNANSCAGSAGLAAFAAFDLLGLRLSPRIRDLASLQLYRLGAATELAALSARLLTAHPTHPDRALIAYASPACFREHISPWGT
jgi:TnpA family transposase